MEQVPEDFLLEPDDRILILSPHPDDDILAAGGLIQQALAAGVPVHIVYLTYGDANQWSFALYRHEPPVRSGSVEAMGEVRCHEARAAEAVLGLDSDHLTFLGYPDHDTLYIWYNHWGDAPPVHGLFTRASAVPYADAYRPGAPYRGQEILRDLKELIGKIHPTKIVVSHPADHNPDHRSLYLFARVALWDLREERASGLYPFLIHYPHWPGGRAAPGFLTPDLPLEPPLELVASSRWLSRPLTEALIQRKLEALQKHRSQYRANPHLLNRFIRTNELFGDFPAIRLAPGEKADLLPPQVPQMPPSHLREEFTRLERELFVEIRKLKIGREDGEIRLEVETSHPLRGGTTLSLYVFGYRPDLPFPQMPKLCVQLEADGRFLLLDQGRMLPEGTRPVAGEPGVTVVGLPLDLLANPDRLLISARVTYARLPLDSAPWRVVWVEG